MVDQLISFVTKFIMSSAFYFTSKEKKILLATTVLGFSFPFFLEAGTLYTAQRVLLEKHPSHLTMLGRSILACFNKDVTTYGIKTSFIGLVAGGFFVWFRRSIPRK